MPAAALPTYSLTPTSVLRARRFNRAALVQPRIVSPNSAYRSSKAHLVTRTFRRNAAVIGGTTARFPWQSILTFPVYVDPRKASSVQVDNDPFGVDPRQAGLRPA